MSETNSAPSFGNFDALMPDGYAEGDDIFNPTGWTGGTGDAQDTSTPAQEPEKELSLEELFADREEDTAPEEAPTTGEAKPEPTPSKLKFKATVDHEDRDVELDESELPNLYQKAQVVDRVQAKLAKMSPQMEKAERLSKDLGYDSVDEMLEAAGNSYKESEVQKLRDGGLQDDLADAVYEWKRSQKYGDTPKPSEAPATPKPDDRDYKAEVRELMDGPYAADIKKTGHVPNEVVTLAVSKHITMSQAYSEYMAGKTKAENDALRKENATLKQNADAAARAPVRRTTRGGSTNTKSDKDDPFLKGFNSDFR